MRTVSLVNRLKWSFSGNMNPHALELGDVDNDGDVEFVIGNLNGDLAIFKGECPTGSPTFICQDLGTITCIAIGDVRNVGKNSLVVVNAEGHCHIFDIPPPTSSQPPTPPTASHTQRQNLVDEYLRQGRRSSDSNNSTHGFRRTGNQMDEGDGGDGSTVQNLQQPNLTLKVPVNVNKILIADIDGDGLNEFILARTDRILHSFQLDHQNTSSTTTTNEKSESPATTASSSPTSTLTSTIQSSLSALSGNKLGSKSNNNDGKELKSHVLRKGMVWKTAKAKDLKDSKTKTDTLQKSNLVDQQMYLKDKDMWVFDGQITSLTTTTYPDRPNEPILLVAQPGNTFTIIDQKGNRLNRDFTPQHGPYIYDRRQRSPYPTMKETQSDIDTKKKSQQQPDTITTTTTTTTSTSTPESTPITNSQPVNINRSGINAHSKDSSTSTIRTLLNRLAMPNDIAVENVIYAKEDENDNSSSKSTTSSNNNNNDTDSNNNDEDGDAAFCTDFERTNYAIQDWPVMDGDDIMGDDKNGAVATEIVIGKRHLPNDHQRCGNEVGMLSMDGKFTIHDLRTKKTSQQDLFVTHKLFSLATLDVSGTPMLPKPLYPARNAPLYFAGSPPQPQQRQQHHQHPRPSHQPLQQHQNLKSRHPSLASASSSPSSSSRAVATTATTTALAHSNTGSPSFSSSSKLSLTISNNNNNGGGQDESLSKSQVLPSPSTTTAISLHTHHDTNNNNNNISSTLQEICLADSGSSGLHASDSQSTIAKLAANQQQFASYRDNNNNLTVGGDHTVSSSRRGSISSSISSDSSWSDLDQDDEDDGPDCDLFVACAWNGVTYLIDWSQRMEDDNDDGDGSGSMDSTATTNEKSDIRFQLVKFAFEGRVCAFTAGLYAMATGYNVPCLFYVDFEDQIFVYYDVRISPGKVTGFIDMMDDDVEEALDRLLGLEDDLSKAMTCNGKQQQLLEEDDEKDEQLHIDLGDGWKGIMEDTSTIDSAILRSNHTDLSEFIHECLYEFDDMKDRLENDLFVFEHEHLPHTISNHSDIRRLSDLNITIEPELESEIPEPEEAMEEQGMFAYDDTRSSQSSDSEILRNWMDENLLRSSLGS